MENYDVIIVGGGPTGLALGIELGLHQVKTLIIEQHARPLISPRAQALNPRSMEFFRRWQIADKLRSKQSFPTEFSLRTVWCSKLNGETYASGGLNDRINDDISPERGIQIPLWITEEVLHARLNDFLCVTFLAEHTVKDVTVAQHHVQVTAINRDSHKMSYKAHYCVACDGANSTTRQKVNVSVETLALPHRMINILFESPGLSKKITVEKGSLFYLLASKNPCTVGLIDFKRGIWHAQIKDSSTTPEIDEIDLEALLNKVVGFKFHKKILEAHFWNMNVFMAKQFSKDNRIFFVGDSAHAFIPMGALGLNTGFGDAVNLAWKLAAVIQQKLSPNLLETYEQERRPIALYNLQLAQKNADDILELGSQYDSKHESLEFSSTVTKLVKQYTHVLGATMGYAYFNSWLTQLQNKQPTTPMPQVTYQPTVAPGYFLPHCWINQQQAIYDVLSAINWTLIVCHDDDEGIKAWREKFGKNNFKLDVLKLMNAKYRYNYILIRPDWHIAWVADQLDDQYLIRLNNHLHKTRLP